MDSAADISAIIAAHQGREGPLLPILHDLQDAFGHIPDAAHGPICQALHISAAELHGVLHFYHDFRTTPRARHVIRVCRAEACQAMGAEDMIARLETALGVKLGSETTDLALEATYCLGLCACGPAAQVDDHLIGRADPDRITTTLREVRA